VEGIDGGVRWNSLRESPNRRIAITGAIALAVFVGVFVKVKLTTTDVASILDKQQTSLSQLEQQLAGLHAQIPDLIEKLTGERDVIHNARIKFFGAGNALRGTTFDSISLAYEMTEKELREAVLLLSNLWLPQQAEESVISLLKENTALYRHLLPRTTETRDETARQKTTLSQNAQRRDTLIAVAERLLGDLGSIIFQHEELWLKLQQGIKNVQPLLDKDHETVQSIELQNQLLTMSGETISIEKKYRETSTMFLRE